MEKHFHYSVLADLFRYPEEDFAEALDKNLKILESAYPEAVAELGSFSDYVKARSNRELRELYTKTFDVQPICYLDLGYVIFKEDYKRGAFLVKMQEEQMKIGNDCGTDLSDNISNVLTLFYKSPDPDLIHELAVKVLIPAVEIMISEFAQQRIDLKIKVLRKLHKAVIQEELNHGNVYRGVFTALHKVLKKDFGHISYVKPEEEIADRERHLSFFRKNSINKAVQQAASRKETSELFQNHKLD